ncbi:AmmeMemoRadiSam system protein B [Bacteroidota bacterium]
MKNIRKPAVAGKFYPDSREDIVYLLEEVVIKEKSKTHSAISGSIIGGVVPHAGYVYCAYEAVHFFEVLKIQNVMIDTIFILHPDHYGYGKNVNLDGNEMWETPMGRVEIDTDFYPYLPFPISKDAHSVEHSGEVILPYLQFFLEYEFKIVPISFSMQNIENAKKVAQSIYDANVKLGKEILLIASSDFSHYVNPAKGKKLDQLVINEIIKLKSEGVYDMIMANNISICGYCPIISLIEYCKLIEEKIKVKILRKGHSGEIFPSEEVVDYVSILFYY